MKLPTSAYMVLVVAPDADLRQSLAFMLSAEGFSVITDASWPPKNAAVTPDLVVIDHAAFARGYAGDGELSALRQKVVILLGRDRALPPLADAVVVRKPLLERELIETLNRLLTAPGGLPA